MIKLARVAEFWVCPGVKTRSSCKLVLVILGVKNLSNKFSVTLICYITLPKNYKIKESDAKIITLLLVY